MEERDMQLPKHKGFIAVLWGVGFFMGILFFFMISEHYAPTEAINDTYLHVVQKSKVLSQMRINLLKSVEMEKNAVMAQSDQESQKFADQSLAASAAVEQDLQNLLPLIHASSLPDEEQLVMEFNTCWTAFRTLDHDILGLAVQNTNLKAADLSREKGAEAIQRFVADLEEVVRSNLGTLNDDRAVVLPSLQAITAGQQILNLHRFHIAEMSDEKMDHIETQMKVKEKEVLQSLDELASSVGQKSRDDVLQAKAAFSEFMEVTAKVVNLSRQNSNIKSLELSLGRKRVIAAQCEEVLAAFQKAVEDRPFKATK
jgi:hypothetical protein